MAIHLMQTLLLCSTTLLCLLSGTANATPLPAQLSVRNLQVPDRAFGSDIVKTRQQECERFGFVLESSIPKANVTTKPNTVKTSNGGAIEANQRVKDTMALICARWGYVALPTSQKSLKARGTGEFGSNTKLEWFLSTMKHILWFLKSGRR